MTLTIHGVAYKALAPHWFEMVGAPLVIAMTADRRSPMADPGPRGVVPPLFRQSQLGRALCGRHVREGAGVTLYGPLAGLLFGLALGWLVWRLAPKRLRGE